MSVSHMAGEEVWKIPKCERVSSEHTTPPSHPFPAVPSRDYEQFVNLPKRNPIFETAPRTFKCNVRNSRHFGVHVRSTPKSICKPHCPLVISTNKNINCEFIHATRTHSKFRSHRAAASARYFAGVCLSLSLSHSPPTLSLSLSLTLSAAVQRENHSQSSEAHRTHHIAFGRIDLKLVNQNNIL